MALLWQAAGERRLFWALAGLFLTSLALNARAGAFLALPALALWLGWLRRGQRRFSLAALSCYGASPFVPPDFEPLPGDVP